MADDLEPVALVALEDVELGLAEVPDAGGRLFQGETLVLHPPPAPEDADDEALAARAEAFHALVLSVLERRPALVRDTPVVADEVEAARAAAYARRAERLERWRIEHLRRGACDVCGCVVQDATKHAEWHLGESA
jgi:hypothetical protein